MVGIEQIRFSTSGHYLELEQLAVARRVDPAKYHTGLGLQQMAVPTPDEDIIALGADAADACLDSIDRQRLDAVILATESGVDAAKAGALYLHRLLDLPSHCQAFELKQACCASTFALQLAADRVARHPDRAVLVVASDIARYPLHSPGEPTQGAGAVALLISAQPRVLRLDPAIGSYAEETMDFWRPPYLDEALVDGRLSVRMYLKALAGSWWAYRRDGGAELSTLDHCCFHVPFPQMAAKAHAHLRTAAGLAGPGPGLEAALSYNRALGNTYTAGLYISLASLLERSAEDLSGRRVGLFGYGSGCTGVFLSGTVPPGYRSALAGARHARLLADRQPLSVAQYEAFHRIRLPTDGTAVQLPERATGRFRLAGVNAHHRHYARRMTPAQVLSDVA